MQTRAQFAWRLLWLSLVCCVFEGAMRKWGVGDASIAGRFAYLSKDIVMAGFILLGGRRGNPLTGIARPFLAAGLALLAVAVVIGAVIDIQLIGAALTIRTFFVLPLACIAAGKLLPADALQRYAYWVAVFSLPLAPLGIMQFYASGDSPINRYSTMEKDDVIAEAGVSRRVRATGTFSYITGFTEFANVAVWAAIVTFTLARTPRERWLGYAALAAGMCCTFVTVSRATALISLGMLAVWAMSGGQFARKAKTLLAVCGACLAVLFFSGRWQAADEIATTVHHRHTAEDSDTFSFRIWYQFVLPLEAITIAPFGKGLGSQQVVASFDTSRKVRILFESGWGRAIMELGVMGVVGFWLTFGVVFAPLFSAYRASQQAELRTVLAVTAAALGAKALVGFQFNHFGAYFFWSIGAAVLALGNRIQQLRTSKAIRLNAQNGATRRQPLGRR